MMNAPAPAPLLCIMDGRIQSSGLHAANNSKQHSSARQTGMRGATRKAVGRVRGGGLEPARWAAVHANGFWDPDARLAAARARSADAPGQRCVVYLDGWPGSCTRGTLDRLRATGYTVADDAQGGGHAVRAAHPQAALDDVLRLPRGQVRHAVVFVRHSPLAPALARFAERAVAGRAPLRGTGLDAAGAGLVEGLD